MPSLLTPDIQVEDLRIRLRTSGCAGCELGTQSKIKGPVVFRGSSQAKVMIIGEGPGENEDITGIPFSGPAGQLLDKIMKAIGIDTNDCYICNVVMCRPIGIPGTGRKNRKPSVVHRKACKPYLLHQINQVSPKIILLLGRTAAEGVLPGFSKGKRMDEIAGKVALSSQFKDIAFFIMYHPAALLHTQNFPEKYQILRRQMWKHALDFKLLLEDGV